VPQRRKRIYLVADFASERAGEILFVTESVRGHSSQGREAGEGTAADAERSVGGSGGVGIGAFMGGQGAKARSIAYCDDGTTPTLKSALSGMNTVPDVCYPADGVKCLNPWSSLSVYENHGQDTRYKGPVDVSQTVSATFGMDGNNTPFVVEKHE
jgi:DNA (cytosine-5)-methyltransferase 1